jgi:hypothetical protein
MSLLPLGIPPGLYRNGTEKQSAGRYHDANLVRWIDKALRPVGGWRPRSSAAAYVGKPRALMNWRDNSGVRWIAVATHSRLYVQDASGVNTDVTPSAGFTAGRPDATLNLGYSGGFYGRGRYGTPRPGTSSNVLPATSWSLDSWGQYLVGCHADDGKLWEWRLDVGQKAAQVSGAPTGCRALVVDENKFLMALGASGVGRRVKWCNQGDNTAWTVSAVSQAGEKDLETKGRLMCGRALKGVTLLFTDTDVWGARYLGYPLVFGFQRVGDGCGVISQSAVAAVDQQAVWMSHDGFWLYDGYARPLPCDVSDMVFGDLNTSQSSKVSAFHMGAYGEVWWLYPSKASTECDRYVIWNYRDGYWNGGALERTCGADKGVNAYPLMAGADGVLYEHETGWDYGAAMPFAEMGPIELGAGDRMVEVQRLIPDERTAGDVTVSFTERAWPNAAETVHGPYSLSSPTDVLFQGRQVKVRFVGARNADWRVGEPRLDLIPGDWE